jgi:hypothetical protein
VINNKLIRTKILVSNNSLKGRVKIGIIINSSKKRWDKIIALVRIKSYAVSRTFWRSQMMARMN